MNITFLPATCLPANSDFHVFEGFFVWFFFPSLSLYFCLFLFTFRSVFIRAKLTFQSLLKLVISMQCPIYLPKYYSQVEDLADLDSFSTEEKAPDSSNLSDRKSVV